MEEDIEVDSKEVSDALHMLLHCSLKDTEYETQKEQFKIVNAYIKQLEEENKGLKKVKSDELIINNPWLFEYLNELYIFKGKVKEKIEKIDERIKYLHTEINKCVEERKKLGTETDIDNNETLIFHLEDEKEELYAKKQALQELLEREGK